MSPEDRAAYEDILKKYGIEEEEEPVAKSAVKPGENKEDEIFNACEKAVGEIISFMRQMVSRLGNQEGIISRNAGAGTMQPTVERKPKKKREDGLRQAEKMAFQYSHQQVE